MKYYQVLVSAENRTQAIRILDSLLEKKLILGGPIIEGPAKFWWKGEIIDIDYGYILTYTREDLKEQMIKVAEEASEEDVCMISCIPFEGNSALIKLLNDTFNS